MQTFTYMAWDDAIHLDFKLFKKENWTENLTYPVVKNILKKNILASY